MTYINIKNHSTKTFVYKVYVQSKNYRNLLRISCSHFVMKKADRLAKTIDKNHFPAFTCSNSINQLREKDNA
jgi:hypothetical protein